MASWLSGSNAIGTSSGFVHPHTTRYTLRSRRVHGEAADLARDQFAVGSPAAQQDRRILQEGARYGDTLPLAARQLDAAVADHGRHALRQVLDEIAARSDRGTQHLIVAGVRPAVADVLHDRPME